MMPTSDFQFYSKTAYFDDITQRITATEAGSQVALATMTFEPSLPPVARLLDALGQAASRGVQANLCIDAHVFLRSHAKKISNKFGPLLFDTQALASPAKLGDEYRQKYAILEKLRSQGVRYTITNQPHRILSNPVGGRSHIKFAVINDRLYIGGCNLDNPDDIDLMTGWDDAASANQLLDFSKNMIAGNGTSFMKDKDRIVATGNGATIYIDAGKRRQSIILQQALELIDRAQARIFMTCQYFPNSITAQHLARAHKRGVEVTIIYNHASKFPKPDHILQHISATTERLRLPAALFKNQLPLTSPYIHAKILASESAAMIGSHNYIPAGVNFGTAEIALLQRDTGFSRQLIYALTSQIADA